MSAFLDEIAAEVKHPGTQQCTVARVLDELADDAMRADLITALRDPRAYTGAAIERALRGRGIRLPASTIQKHRRPGDCSCPEASKPPVT